MGLAKQHGDYHPMWMPLNLDHLKSHWMETEDVVISVGLSSCSPQDGCPLGAVLDTLEVLLCLCRKKT